MRHSLTARGLRFALRPVAEADAAFILQVRRGHPFIARGAESLQQQREWLASYFDREHDYCFVVEDVSTGEPHGLVGIYSIDRERNCAEWGRWVLRAGSPAACESALLVYTCAFNELGLAKVYCRTLAENAQVVSFHDSCGLERMAQAVEVTVDGNPRLAVEHHLAREHWPIVRRRLAALAERFAQRGKAAASTS
ncbi:MAG TPA: GNAT family N-acetyltransferase [Burkholderiales bacterium]|nr:GNAT family N-acetyltransferase [Burkholderiales bacterium]